MKFSILNDMKSKLITAFTAAVLALTATYPRSVKYMSPHEKQCPISWK